MAAKSRARGAVLITGTDSGIGAACAEYLDGLGFRVFAGVLDRTALETKRGTRPARIRPVVLNVAKPEDIESACASITESVGAAGLFGLVNNAGYAIGGPLEYLPIEVMRRQFEVNFFGTLAVTQAFLPLIRAGQGRIINIGSPSGTLVLPFLSPYAASKAAIKAMTEVLRIELRPWNIPVSLIEPGRILTGIWRQSTDDSAALLENYPEEAIQRYRPVMEALVRMNTGAAARGLPPARVAQVVGRVLTCGRPRARYYVGWDSRLLTLAAHVVPTRLRDRVISDAITRFITKE
jgi:NAD(P)-dependent dehydrogenase (short-subunit alcohol dehydrogenase family)